MKKPCSILYLKLDPDIACFIAWIIFVIFGITTSASPLQEHFIAFSPEEGDNLLFMLDTSVQFSGKDFSGEKVSLGASASGEISFFVIRNTQNLVFTGLTSPGIQVTAQTLEGAQSYTLQTIDDMMIHATFDHSGRAHGIENIAALNRDRIWNIPFVQIIRNYLPVLPDSPVSIGATWYDQKNFNIPYQEIVLDVEVERHFALQDILSSFGGDIALISVEYKVRLSGSKKQGEWEASFEGKGAGSGTLNFHIERNCIQEFRAEYLTEASLILESRGKRYGQLPFHLNISASLVLIN